MSDEVSFLVCPDCCQSIWPLNLLAHSSLLVSLVTNVKTKSQEFYRLIGWYFLVFPNETFII